MRRSEIMGRNAIPITLNLESLRVIGGSSADCAEKSLSVFENYAESDSRPRQAIEGIRVFALGERRTARLRTLAMEAFSAAREIGVPAASAAARAAGLAASSAYTHPLADVQQTKHIVGPAAYAALALELDHAGYQIFSESVVKWAIENAPAEVSDVLAQMHARQKGKSRLDGLLFALDKGLRSHGCFETQLINHHQIFMTYEYLYGWSLIAK